MPKPTILIDTREQRPLKFGGSTPTRVATLTTGDYSVTTADLDFSTHIAIERKSIADLLGCIGQSRDRFEREVERLAALWYGAIVVEGSMQDVLRGTPHSKVHPASVMGSLRAWDQRFGVRVHFAGDRLTAAAWVRKMLWGFVDDWEQGKLPPLGVIVRAPTSQVLDKD